MSIPQVHELRSTASDGNAQFVIIYEFDKDMTESGDEIRNSIAAVRYKLPLEMREPVMYRWDPASEPIMNLGLSSTKLSHAEISRLAEDVLADQLRAVDGVAVVNIDGALRRELSVLLHAQKLREYNVAAGEVVAALRDQNTTAPVGRVKGELEEQNIRLVGRIERPSDFNDIVIKRQGNEVVRLGPGRHRRRRLCRARQLQSAFGPAERRPVDHPPARSQYGIRGRARADENRGTQQDIAGRHGPRSHARRR